MQVLLDLDFQLTSVLSPQSPYYVIINPVPPPRCLCLILMEDIFIYSFLELLLVYIHILDFSLLHLGLSLHFAGSHYYITYFCKAKP